MISSSESGNVEISHDFRCVKHFADRRTADRPCWKNLEFGQKKKLIPWGSPMIRQEIGGRGCNTFSASLHEFFSRSPPLEDFSPARIFLGDGGGQDLLLQSQYLHSRQSDCLELSLHTNNSLFFFACHSHFALLSKL